jgi:FkbM family methyltransferase
MIIDLEKLKEKYHLNLNGVIHIGAHYGKEYDVYEKLNIKNKMFFEPVSKTFGILQQNLKYKDVILVNKAVGNENTKIKINIETHNEGQSNSILNPKIHLHQYPHIQFHSTEEVEMVKLDDFVQNKENYNFLNIDIQGYELEALKGAKHLLNNIDYVMTEINRAEVYENCAQINDLVSFLSEYNFKLVEQDWAGDTWGDGFFIKGG